LLQPADAVVGKAMAATAAVISAVKTRELVIPLMPQFMIQPNGAGSSTKDGNIALREIINGAFRCDIRERKDAPQKPHRRQLPLSRPCPLC
jgi:hypothetical protein